MLTQFHSLLEFQDRKISFNKGYCQRKHFLIKIDLKDFDIPLDKQSRKYIMEWKLTEVTLMKLLL